MDGFFQKFSRCMRNQTDNNTSSLIENIPYDNKIHNKRYLK